MNLYLNLKPNNYTGDSDLITLDLPSGMTDDIMKYVRPIADDYDKSEVKVLKEGSTTTSAAILYDILRKISSNSDLVFDLKTENKLSLKSDNSDFNSLNNACIPSSRQSCLCPYFLRDIRAKWPVAGV